MPWPHKEPAKTYDSDENQYWRGMPVRVTKGDAFKGWEGQATSAGNGNVYVTFPYRGKDITFQALQLHRIEPEELK